jgi:hypothetical protein
MNFGHFRSRYLDWFHFGTGPSWFESCMCRSRVRQLPRKWLQAYAPELDDEKKPAHELVERIASELRCGDFKLETAVVTSANGTR